MPESFLRRRLRRARRALFGLAGVLGLYLLLAFVILPACWRLHYRHPALEDSPRVTRHPSGRAGDPLNIALVGGDEEVVRLLVAAGWQPADKITFNSCYKMVSATVLRRAYEKAPVSALRLYGRPQDFAFQQMDGKSPVKRHHVRFWKSDQLDDDGRPLWLGAATYDDAVKVDLHTFQPTHRVAADVDAERNKLLDDLRRTGQLAQVHWMYRFHTVLKGTNGGGDPWRTDGHLAVGTIAPGNVVPEGLAAR